LFFEFPHRRFPAGDCGREKRCTKPEEEGVPREGDAQALADRDSGEPVSSALRRACREGERGGWKGSWEEGPGSRAQRRGA